MTSGRKRTLTILEHLRHLLVGVNKSTPIQEFHECIILPLALILAFLSDSLLFSPHPYNII